MSVVRKCPDYFLMESSPLFSLQCNTLCNFMRRRSFNVGRDVGSVSLFPFIFLLDYALDSAELDSICHLSAAFNEA